MSNGWWLSNNKQFSLIWKSDPWGISMAKFQNIHQILPAYKAAQNVCFKIS